MDNENGKTEHEVTTSTTTEHGPVTAEHGPAATEYRPATEQRTVTTDHTTGWSATSVRIVYFILGIFEAFLALRLILKLLAANTGNTFVDFIYYISKVLLAPFSGIFKIATSSGEGVKSVLEPATLVAMLVYALIAWGIVRLIMIYRQRKTS